MAAKSKPPLSRDTDVRSSQRLTDPGLLRVYSSWARELQARYERVSDLFRHAPSIGRSRELYLAQTLQRALPAHLAVRHGAFYVPGHGASSEQDILIVDLSKLAPIEEIDGFGVYYADSVVGCIEVKSNLSRGELQSAMAAMVTAKMVGPGRALFAIFAYETPLSADQLLDALENTVESFDNRVFPIVVLGKFVVSVTSLQPKKPRPQYEVTVFEPKSPSLDLTLLQLVEHLFEISNESPLEGLWPEIREHFDPVATRTVVCPEERPGTGLGTNRW